MNNVYNTLWKKFKGQQMSKKMSFCQYFGFINLLQDKLAIIMDNYQLTEKYQYQKEISKQNKQQLKKYKGIFLCNPLVSVSSVSPDVCSGIIPLV